MIFRTPPDQLVMGTYGPLPFRRAVRLPVAALTTHLRVAGVSGMGKSRYLAHLFLSLIRQGHAATLLDPHADTARLVFAHLVAGGFYTDPTAFERVAYWDPPGAAAVGRYLPLNVLDQPFDAPTTSRLVLEALRRAWPGLEGGVAPAFENAVLAGVSLLVRHKLPLPLLHDVLTDDGWRRRLLTGVTDPATRGFFARLDSWTNRERAQYLGSTLRRSFLLNFSPVLRLSLGQAENTVRMGERMRAGQSAIVNLALPDGDARRLLGSLFTVFVEQAALQRLALPPGERGPLHFLFVDEWSQFASQSGTAITTMLEQTRKAGVGLVLASQTEGQLSERVRAAAQNAGTSAIFRLGRADAEPVAPTLDRPDPYTVKHEVRDKALRKRMHPLYRGLAEQREGWVGAIQRLPPLLPAAAERAGGHARRATPARCGRGRGATGGGGGAVPDERVLAGGGGGGGVAVGAARHRADAHEATRARGGHGRGLSTVPRPVAEMVRSDPETPLFRSYKFR